MKPAILRLFYLGVAVAVAVVLIIVVWVIGFSLTLDKIFSAIAASFLVVSLISLVGDQEILNFLAKVSSNFFDPYDAGNKGALKDGKSINLVATALLSLVAAIIKLVS